MVKASIEAKVRPLSNNSLDKASLLGAARLYVSKDALISLTGGLDGNRLCFVERITAEGNETGTVQPALAPLRREASLWVLPGQNISPNVVMVTRAFQEATGLKVGESVRLSVGEGVPDAEEVVVEDVTGGEADGDMRYAPCWESSIGLSLDRAEQAFPGMTLEGVSINKLRRNFKVLSVNGSVNSVAKFQLSSTLISILQPGQTVPGAEKAATGGDLVLSGVPGMSAQVEAINHFLEGFSRPFWTKREWESCAYVIHGGHGTGKTFILERLAATGWGKAHWIRHFDKLSTIRETFKLARSQKPSLLFIEDLGETFSKDRSNKDSVVHTICEELDSLSAEALANDALPRVVVIATCADYMTDVPQALRKRSRFYDNIALPIPGQSERLEMLEFMEPPLAPTEKERILGNLAQNTHAYNPNDLGNLMMAAKRNRGRRLKAAKEGAEEDVYLAQEDIDQAFRVTKPTAMNDINLKPPTIHWQDVGGQESLKKVLSNMIKFAKNTNPGYRRVLRNPPKGLLLYGPPGCSKTLSAQAMATESSFNFFAVKGAELLNMYVGESERAVRTLFERARAASPSIIFFDEIDSIAGSRPGGGGGGGGASKSSGAVNTVTTLLTEMDGFESLTGVLVLAATNRPEAIDPALLRPGRFDQVLYVGPPDQAAREAVFRVHLRGLDVGPDVDITELATIADGYSGAEIKAICNDAGMVALERHEEDGSALEITMGDLRVSMGRTPRNITKGMIEGYEKWLKQFKKS